MIKIKMFSEEEFEEFKSWLKENKNIDVDISLYKSIYHYYLQEILKKRECEMCNRFYKDSELRRIVLDEEKKIVCDDCYEYLYKLNY